MSSEPQWKAWLLAIRPRTLPVAAAPVVVGTAVAFSAGQARLGPALAAALGALGLQVASNLANDLFDFESGADAEDLRVPVVVGAKEAHDVDLDQRVRSPLAKLVRGIVQERERERKHCERGTQGEKYGRSPRLE